MKKNFRFFLTIFWLIIGTLLFILSLNGIIDEYWSGMGGGLVGVGIAQLIRHIRYHTNNDYKEKIDISISDERNKYISTKAWAWAGYWFVLIFGVMTIVFKLLGNDLLSHYSAISVCVIMVLYWLCFMYLKKKY